MEHWKARLAFVDSQERFAYEILSGGKTIVTTRLAERNTSEIVTLIAAAPELLEALETVAGIAHSLNAQQHSGVTIQPECWSRLWNATQTARAVINKAKPWRD